MLFLAYSDTGSCIRAYCVPDSFSTVPSLKILVDGAHVRTLASNDHNQHVAGRHETGQVGFTIDETIVEGLAGIVDLELRDEETDMLVYRRSPAHAVLDHPVFRLETRLLPMRQLDHTLKPRFRFWYERIDRYAAETVRQIFSLVEFKSIFSSGRVLFSNYDFYLWGKNKSVVLIRDPVVELAERLLILGHLGGEPGRLFSERDALIFAPALAFATQLGDIDKADLGRSFRKASPEALAVFSNPLVRQLTAATPDAPAGKGSVSKALRTLAEFELVGIEEDEDTFLKALAELLGEADMVLPKTVQSPLVAGLAEKLRGLRPVQDLLDNDLDLYRHVQAAHKAG